MPRRLATKGLASASALPSDQRPGQGSTLWQSVASYIPGTQQYRASAKLRPRSNSLVLYTLSGSILLLVLFTHFLSSRSSSALPYPSSPPPRPSQTPLDPFGDSVYRQEAYYDLLEPGTQCRPKSPFSSDLPVTPPLTNMALEAETKRMVAQFEYSADDVNKGVKEFVREMEEGLEKQGTSISQIPTYVTSVPNGTETV
jgi:hypothetical protein